MSRLLPKDDPTSIGNVLVTMGVLTKDELKQVTDAHKKSDVNEFFGQCVSCKLGIPRDQIEMALLKQKVMRGRATNKIITKALSLCSKNQEKLAGSAEELVLLAQMVTIKVSDE